MRHEVTACGLMGQCSVQFVIEADGSVYPCDFYVRDRYRLGDIQHATLSELFHTPQATAWLKRPRTPIAMCQQCQFQALCHGGCPRMQTAMYVDEAQGFCGYQAVLTAILPKLPQIAAIVAAASTKENL